MTVILDISNKRWFAEKEAVVYTSFSTETLREARDLNQLPFRKKGAKIIYEKKDLDAYMESLDLHKDGRIRTYKKTTYSMKKIISTVHLIILGIVLFIPLTIIFTIYDIIENTQLPENENETY